MTSQDLQCSRISPIDAESYAAAAVLDIAADAQLIARREGWLDVGVTWQPGDLLEMEGWCYPLVLCDGESEPAGVDHEGLCRAWPLAHTAWSSRPLDDADSPLALVVLDPPHGDWPGCVLAIGSIAEAPRAFAVSLLGDDPQAAVRRLAADLAGRGHPGARAFLPSAVSTNQVADGLPARPRRAGKPLTRRARLTVALVLAVGIVVVPRAPEPRPEMAAVLREVLEPGPALALDGRDDADGSAVPGNDEEATSAGSTSSDARRPGDDDPLAGANISFGVPEGGYAELGEVFIPAIDLRTAFASGVYEEALTNGPGHWPGTPLPGQPGNAVLSGHRTTFTAPFNRLDELVAGNHIGVTIGGNAEVVYQVTETLIVPEADYVGVVTAQPSTDVHQITLFACHPAGQRTNRIVVRAQIEPLPVQDLNNVNDADDRGLTV
ncbi:MAG: sortase [Euzebya sp.]